MSGTIDRRLEKLTTVLRPVGCQVCGWWSSAHAVLCDDHGTCTRPEVCRGCGRYVPIVDRLIIGGIDLDLV